MGECDAPTMLISHIALHASIANFVADDAADGCTADGSDRAAACQDGTADGANASADGGTLVLRRHAGTAAHSDQHGCGNNTQRESL
jgi:hypothetical protein